MAVLFPELQIESGAEFSPCAKYRYSLWRVWNNNLPMLGTILLNPSTATAVEDDPTVSRMITRARHLGYGGIYLCNIFAYRATNPEELYGPIDPVGPHNDAWIAHEMSRCNREILCGWGKHGTLRGRGKDVYTLLSSLRQEYGVPSDVMQLCALGRNLDGTPVHPLYIPYSDKPKPYNPVEVLQ